MNQSSKNQELWSLTECKPGDLVIVQEWDCDPKIGVVIGIDGEWDDGEPPGMGWTTYLEIQFPDGWIASYDTRMCTSIE